MLSIRLSRVGTKKAPVYRIVVMPKHNDPWAKTTEILGHYNPRKNPSELVINADRTKYWIGVGAQATNTVWNLLIDEKIVEGEKRGVTHLSKKRTGKLEEKAVVQKEKTEAAAEKAKAAEETAKAEAEAEKEAAKAAKEAAKAEAEAAKAAPAPEATAEEASTESVVEEAPATPEAPVEEAPAE
ncbi:30S ribosomal protein S16 [Candidatus Uhrbacteria bacterium]|nr:30S ribosomal protein S16 [Candidatus Uhrbacteria bacterium]